MEYAIALTGFTLAAYSVVGNDVIQTLGTFLTSNEKRPWWVLWLFAGGIMAAILILGYTGQGAFLGGNDVAFDRLDKIIKSEGEINLSFWYLLPPAILLLITRLGIPVSTTFLILSFFSLKNLPGMLNKSLIGYAVAFGFALVMYFILSRSTEKYFINNPMGSKNNLMTNRNFWVVLQWLSTGFLWAQWLTQDLANIYIYLGDPEKIDPTTFFVTVAILLGMLAYIFYQKGGAIQGIVKSKTNTADIRSATFIDLFYGICLYLFKYNALGLWEAKLPMSTTWVFLGLLAGRELAIRFSLGPKPDRKLSTMIFADLGKAALGLIISIALVVMLYTVEGKDISVLFSF
ncbi:MAG: hypothetical protein AAFY71_09055 [Bacteroidota bacterium]